VKDLVADESPGMTGAADGSSTPDEAQLTQKRGTRQLLVGRAIFLVLSYVGSVILARTLAPAAFGVYGLLLSVLVWLEMLSFIGVPGALGKLIPDHQSQTREVEQSARAVLLVTSLLVFAIGWYLAPRLGHLFGIADGARLFRLALLDVPFSAACAGYTGALNGRRRFGPLAASQVLLGATKCLGAIALVYLGMSVGRALVVNVLASCAALLYLVVRYPPEGFRPVWSLMREVVSLGGQISMFVVCLNVLTSLDLWSLGSLWHGDAAVIGRYVAALKISQMLTVIPIVQSGVVLSSVAWALSEGNRRGAHEHVREAGRFSLILGAPAVVILGGSASSLMSLVYSSDYASGGIFLTVQLIAYAWFALLDSLAYGLMAAGRQRATAGVLLAFMPVVGLANYLLIPSMGPMGAALSLMLGMFGVGVTITVLTWREFGPPVPLGTSIRVAIASLVVAVPAIFVHTSGLLVLVKLTGLAAAYLGVLWLLGEIDAQDLVIPSARAVQEAASVSGGSATLQD